jgi:hypothetical protein
VCIYNGFQLIDPSDDDDLCQKLLVEIDLGECSTIGFQNKRPQHGQYIKKGVICMYLMRF